MADKSGAGQASSASTHSLGVGPVWARISGFPFWPARPCDEAEEKLILSRRPRSKHGQVAVVFLGRCEK
jgi:hypothetical protein